MKKTLSRFLIAGCALLMHTCAFSQEYHSNDITPAGTASGRLSGTAGGTQVGAAALTGAYSHAVLLSGNALTAVDLHPAAYYYSMAMCTDGRQQGGWGYSMTTGGVHALVWNGSSASCADLNPSGYNFSYCLGVDNGEQVGYAQNQVYFITASHAMCWHDSAASAVDLHPVSTYPYSRALGCRNGEEVGYISTLAYPDGDAAGYHTTSHAMRWAGTAASAVDLHPVGYDASEATCTSGTQQGGWGYLALGTTHQHAMLWSGDAAGAVDLHPAGYTDSKVTAITATNQVGEGWIGTAGVTGSVRHALLWSGTADSAIDLNQYLPAGYTNAVATGIDANGNVVGYAYNGAHPYGLAIPADSIAVVFAPGAPNPVQISSLTLSAANVVPGDTVTGVVTLGGPAPAGGTAIQFLSTQTTLVPTPASIVVPEGDSSAAFTVTTGGATLNVPTSLKIYATDGAVSRVAPLTLTPLVKLSAVAVNTVEGGFSTYGAVSLNIPAQFGGATVALSSGNPGLVTLPSSLTLPQGYTATNFFVSTVPVTQTTLVPITATFNGSTVTGSLTLSPAPVVSLAALSGQEVVGGQSMPVTVTLNNFPRAAQGAVITLTSSDTKTLQVPATVTVPMGAYSATVMATTVVVNGAKGVTLKATYNGSSLTTTVAVDPIPVVTITQADYLLDTKMLKVAATTPYANSVLTYGDTANGPFGTMQFELGMYKGSIILNTPPTSVTVWSSVGGFATMPVTIKTGAGGGGGGGGTGGGGGGSTATTFKLTIVTNGKGTVTASPAAASYAAGTVVTLTATPAAGSPWIGWSGAVTGTALTTTVTITKDTSVTANFR
ncbi:MAG: hypothetical protein JWL77_5568 [Chthonomonadaceae bacterium]|nr:hypothetical protein [Chthonomonadaceae bacterium]